MLTIICKPLNYLLNCQTSSTLKKGISLYVLMLIISHLIGKRILEKHMLSIVMLIDNTAVTNGNKCFHDKKIIQPNHLEHESF